MNATDHALVWQRLEALNPPSYSKLHPSAKCLTASAKHSPQQFSLKLFLTSPYRFPLKVCPLARSVPDLTPSISRGPHEKVFYNQHDSSHFRRAWGRTGRDAVSMGLARRRRSLPGTCTTMSANWTDEFAPVASAEANPLHPTDAPCRRLGSFVQTELPARGSM